MTSDFIEKFILLVSGLLVFVGSSAIAGLWVGLTLWHAKLIFEWLS